jgi:D-amino-acid oxidase
MPDNVAIIGAGVSGLTAAVALSERGFKPTVFADELPARTTSAVAAAVWFPYDAEPEQLVTAWGLISYGRFLELSNVETSGVTMIDFHYLSARDNVEVPSWADSIGYRRLVPTAEDRYLSGYVVRVPVMDTTCYLPYLQMRAGLADEAIQRTHLHDLHEVSQEYRVIVNCSGYGARTLVPDDALVAHRGQVVIVEKLGQKNGFVLEEPLTYVIPRKDDCVLGGVNLDSASTAVDREVSEQIVARCAAMLKVSPSPHIKRELVGIRPARRGGVALHANRLRDGRLVIHNYGHGGCGLSLSWGCAQKVVELVTMFSGSA